MEHEGWPQLPYEQWLPTYRTLHRYTQIAGKIKLALSPFLNEWWHAALFPRARGLTTGIIPFRGRLFEITFDCLGHNLTVLDSKGRMRSFELGDRSVADFYALLFATLEELDIEVAIDPTPQEMESTVPLNVDTSDFQYDRASVERFWNLLSRVAGVFEQFRSGFSGKASPVHFWWGSFDLNLTRYSGRGCSAPSHAPRLARIDCDEEHFSGGFWPGNEKFPQPAFYAYGYPAPKGIEGQRISPEGSKWDPAMGELILPYDTVRVSPDPEGAILKFLETSYRAIADLGDWDRAFLERTVK